MKNPLHTWSYFREKYYTISGCIEREFPELRKDPQIKVALREIWKAEKLIEARVAELQEQNPPDYNDV
jgi:hypothetical protein